MKKNYLINIMFYTCLLIFAASCAKEVVQAEKPISRIGPDKFKRMEKFISIAWATPPEQVFYNSEKQEFTFGKQMRIVMGIARVESLYDEANEYKLNNEK